MPEKRLVERPQFIKLTVFSVVLSILAIGIFIAGCITALPEQNTLSTASSGQSVSFTDSANNSFSLPLPAEKIVALQRDSIECLIIMGAGDRIVGVPDYVANDPRFMKWLPNAVNVGASATPDVELISSLKPDIIISMNSTSQSLRNRFRNLNMTLAFFDCYIIQNVPSSMVNLGIMTGKSKNAERYLEFYNRMDTLISDRVNNISPDRQPDVYYELSTDYVTAGSGSGGDAILKKMRANNIAKDLPIQWPTISPEWVVSNDPDVIIKMVERSTERNNNFHVIYQDLLDRPGFSDISAVKNGRVHIVSGNIVYGPRGIIGHLYIGKILYPEQFADINPSSMLKQYAVEFLPDSDDIDTIYPDLNNFDQSIDNTGLLG